MSGLAEGPFKPNSTIPTKKEPGPCLETTIAPADLTGKEAKGLVLLRRKLVFTRRSAKPIQGIWGHVPKKTIESMNC